MNNELDVNPQLLNYWMKSLEPLLKAFCKVGRPVIPLIIRILLILLIVACVFLMIDLTIIEVEGEGAAFISKDYIIVLPFVIFVSLIFLIAINNILNNSYYYKYKKYSKLHAKGKHLQIKLERLNNVTTDTNGHK